jgi:DNA-binding NarL/FixJ family response regulator
VSINICIADGQARVRYGLRILLEQQPGWQIAGEAANALELLTILDRSSPDLLLIDWQLPGLSPRELLNLLHLAYPHLFVISLSGQSELRQAALAAGADLFVSKTEPPGKLISLIQELQTDGIL